MRLNITPTGTDPRLKTTLDWVASIALLLLAIAVVGFATTRIHESFCPRRLPEHYAIVGTEFDERGLDECHYSTAVKAWICTGKYSSCYPLDADRWSCEKAR